MRRNNFDFLRWAAASLVVFSHSFQVVSGSPVAATDPMYVVTGGQMTLGTLGVAVFFVMSGYLITGSWQRLQSPLIYFWHRSLRIFPALAVVVLLTALVMGPLVTSAPSYWSDPGVIQYLKNIALGAQQDLPGVFTSNPIDLVNAPLWTLKYEFGCYILIAALGILRVLRTPVVVALMGITTVLFIGLEATGRDVNNWIDLTRYFLAGSCVWMLRERFTPNLKWFIGAVVVAVVSAFVGQLNAVLPIASGVAVIYLAQSQFAAGWGRYGDFSYGIYIFGWLIQQLVVQYVGVTSAWVNFVVAYPITLALAMISWHLIEKPALSLKDQVKNLLARRRVASS